MHGTKPIDVWVLTFGAFMHLLLGLMCLAWSLFMLANKSYWNGRNQLIGGHVSINSFLINYVPNSFLFIYDALLDYCLEFAQIL